MLSSSLLIPSPAARSKKRPHSALDIFSLSPPLKQKRARRHGVIGIEEVEDVPQGSRKQSVDKGLQDAPRASPTPGSQSVLELDSESTPSLDEHDSEETSSCGSSSESGDELEEAQNDVAARDLLSAEESTSTSSSSSCSDSGSNSGSDSDLDSESAHPSASPSPVRTIPPALPGISASDLSARLNAFLPAIAVANAELEEERSRGNLKDRDIENVDDDGYIEMNLGLGVLEEKNEDVSSDFRDDSSDGDDVEGEGGVGLKKSEDLLGKLMGNSGEKREKPGIQEVGCD